MRASSVLPSAKRPPSAVEAASPFAFAPAARRTEAARAPATGAERERRARPRGPGSGRQGWVRFVTQNHTDTTRFIRYVSYFAVPPRAHHTSVSLTV